MNFSKQNGIQQRGVTLVELLVVISILSVMTAIMIPRLRVLNKDRNIREAARVVASTLVKASNRAIDEGVAGFIIERHDNFVDAHSVNYAGIRMYIMRRLPPYAGDDLDAKALVSGVTNVSMNVTILAPLEHSDTVKLINIGDEVRLNYSSVRYKIVNVGNIIPGNSTQSAKLRLRVSLGISGYGVRPKLNDGAYPFVIYRQPRKLESSQVDLPDGYFIDLRLSGPLVPTPSTVPSDPDWERGSVLDDAIIPRPNFDDVTLYFNSHGSIERFVTSVGVPSSPIPTGPFYFYVTNYDPDTTNDALRSLQNPAGMWVTIDNTTGSVNVAYNAPPSATLPIFNQIQYARGFGRTKQSANQ